MPAIRNLPYKRCEWRSPKCKQTWTKWLCTARRRAYCVCQQFKHGRTRKHNSLSLYTRWQRPCAGADLYHCSIIHSKIRSTSVENRACTAVKLNQEKSVLSCVHNLVSLAVYSKRSVHVLIIRVHVENCACTASACSVGLERKISACVACSTISLRSLLRCTSGGAQHNTIKLWLSLVIIDVTLFSTICGDDKIDLTWEKSGVTFHRKCNSACHSPFVECDDKVGKSGVSSRM